MNDKQPQKTNNEEKDVIDEVEKKEVRVEGEVEPPHQESDLKPDDMVEVEQEPLGEEKTESEKEISADNITPVVEVEDEPLPEIYSKAEIPPDKASKKIETLGEYKPPDPESTTAPEPKIPKFTRRDTEKPEDFQARFKKKLIDLLAVANKTRLDTVEKNLDAIMQYAYEHQKITNNDVEKITGVGHRQAVNYLNLLVEQGKIIRFGKTHNIFYKPVST